MKKIYYIIAICCLFTLVMGVFNSPHLPCLDDASLKAMDQEFFQVLNKNAFLLGVFYGSSLTIIGVFSLLFFKKALAYNCKKNR